MRLTYDATKDVAYLELRDMATYDATGPALLPEPDHAPHALSVERSG